MNGNALYQSPWMVDVYQNRLCSDVIDHCELANLFLKTGYSLSFKLNENMILSCFDEKIQIDFRDLNSLIDFVNTQNLKINIRGLLDNENKLQTELTQLQTKISEIKGKIKSINLKIF